MSTFALSVAGFVVLIIANMWAFAMVFVRWPRVSVETKRHLYTGHTQAKIVLTVINRGAEAVTISNIGLRREDGGGARDFEYDLLHDPLKLPDSNNDPLPVRIEGHGALRWMYGPQLLSDHRGIDVRGYAKVYTWYRWPWRKDFTEKTIEASRTARVD